MVIKFKSLCIQHVKHIILLYDENCWVVKHTTDFKFVGNSDHPFMANKAKRNTY